MTRFARALTATLGLIVLGCTVSLVSQKPAAGAGGAPVTIMNPLPLPVTGSVNATVSGNVGVNNFPTTQNVSFNGSAQPVTFSSTSLAPVFVDTNAPARSAVSGNCLSALSGTGFATCNVVNVPSGKILVVDSVSTLIEVSAGKAVAGVIVGLVANDVSGAASNFQYHLPVSLVTSTAFGNTYAFAGPVNLYAIGNNPVLIEVLTNDTSQTGQIFFDLSGHLVTP